MPGGTEGPYRRLGEKRHGQTTHPGHGDVYKRQAEDGVDHHIVLFVHKGVDIGGRLLVVDQGNASGDGLIAAEGAPISLKADKSVTAVGQLDVYKRQDKGSP